MASPFLYLADDRLSVAELWAACLDGHLVELGEAFIPADAVETASLRAASLRALVGDVLAATHLSAAWVHGALPRPPARHTVQRAVPRRIQPPLGRRVVYRDPFVPAEALMTLGGIMVTTPARTLVDLARTGDPVHAEAAAVLSRAERGIAERALATISGSGPFPGKRAALRMIRQFAATGQDCVTR